eukprot:COSAG02_NODE_5924_length_3938_cov_4.300078_2_plen_500_part_00
MALGGFGGFAGSMDGGSIAAPLSPPALRRVTDADGGVQPDKAGGVSLVTDEQRAAMLLLQDPVYRECAARLENLRAIHHKEKEALSKAAVAGPAPSPSGVLREDVQGRRLQAQRLKRLEMLGSQLELALQNQRRYVLGRAGIAHLADGLVHLQGLGRLNESSAWIAPGGAAILESPHRDNNLETTSAAALTDTERAPALLPASNAELAQHGTSHLPAPTQKANLDSAAALRSGGLRLDLMSVEGTQDMKAVQSTVEWTADVEAQAQREPPPPLQEEKMLPAQDGSSAVAEQDSLSEHSPTGSEIDAASFGEHVTCTYETERLDPDDGSNDSNYEAGAMATSERDAMSAQLLDQLQRMEAQHLDSAECEPRTDDLPEACQLHNNLTWRNARRRYSDVPRGATLIIQKNQRVAQTKHPEPSTGTLPAGDGGREDQESQRRHRLRGKRSSRLRPLRRTRASALEERSGTNAIPYVVAALAQNIISSQPAHDACAHSGTKFSR